MKNFTVTINWAEGEPTIMRNQSERNAMNLATLYNEKAQNPEHGIVSVSVSQDA